MRHAPRHFAMICLAQMLGALVLLPWLHTRQHAHPSRSSGSHSTHRPHAAHRHQHEHPHALWSKALVEHEHAEPQQLPHEHTLVEHEHAEPQQRPHEHTLVEHEHEHARVEHEHEHARVEHEHDSTLEPLEPGEPHEHAEHAPLPAYQQHAPSSYADDQEHAHAPHEGSTPEPPDHSHPGDTPGHHGEHSLAHLTAFFLEAKLPALPPVVQRLSLCALLLPAGRRPAAPQRRAHTVRGPPPLLLA